MPDQPVRRRRVIFCTGYDPNGPGFFHDLFQRQFDRYCQRFGLSGHVTTYQNDEDGVCSHWDVELSHDDWSGQTHYSVFNWDDLVNGYMERPKIVTLLLKLVYDLDAVLTGTFWRMCRLNWRFGLACAYPTLALLVLLICGLAVAFGVHAIGRSWGVPSWPVYGLSAVTAWGVFQLGYAYMSRKHFLHLLLTDGIFSMQHARGRRPDYLERVDEFARRLVQAVKESTDDEVVVVGHSSGSFCAVEIVASALRMDPDLAKRGPRVSLLTVGANLPLIGCHPRATSFREDVALVATEQRLFWLEYQSIQDMLNFPYFDPIRDLPAIELGSPQANPVVHSGCLRKSMTPANYRRFRFHCFRMHYQCVMAVDRLVPCDYMMIVSGPASLELRGLDPQAAMVMCHGPDAWSGTQEELQPWLPLPPGREGSFATTVSGSLQAAPRTISRRTSVILQTLAVFLAFVAGLAVAESQPSKNAPKDDPWTSKADRQLEADNLEQVGPAEVVSSPHHRRST